MKNYVIYFLPIMLLFFTKCNFHKEYQYVVPVNGSNIEVTEESSAIKGFKMSIPENAISAPLNLVIKETDPPEIENESFLAAGPAIEIKSTGAPAVFSEEITITLPVKGEITNIPIVGYFNEETKKWEYLRPDTSNIQQDVISFKTKHCSIFMPMFYDIGDLSEIAKFVQSELGTYKDVINNKQFSEGQLLEITTKIRAKADEAYLNMKKQSANYDACKKRNTCNMLYGDIDKMIKQTSEIITSQITEKILTEVVLKGVGGAAVVKTAFLLGDVISAAIVIDCLYCFLPNSIVSKDFCTNYVKYMYYEALLKELEKTEDEVYLATTREYKGYEYETLVHILDFKYGFDNQLKDIYYTLIKYYNNSKSKKEQKLNITLSKGNSWVVMFPNSKSIHKISKKNDKIEWIKPDGISVLFDTKSKYGLEWDKDITDTGVIINPGPIEYVCVFGLKLASADTIYFTIGCGGTEISGQPIYLLSENGAEFNSKLLNKKAKITYHLDVLTEMDDAYDYFDYSIYKMELLSNSDDKKETSKSSIFGRVWGPTNTPAGNAYVFVTNEALTELYGETLTLSEKKGDLQPGSYKIEGLPSSKKLYIYTFHDKIPGRNGFKEVVLNDNESRKVILDISLSYSAPGFLRIPTLLKQATFSNEADKLIKQLKVLSEGKTQK